MDGACQIRTNLTLNVHQNNGYFKKIIIIITSAKYMSRKERFEYLLI